MRTLLCCIGRLENQYIREFVEWYKNLGFSNVCLYDNNKDGEEHFEDVIRDYIDSGFVILKNYRNRMVCQLDAYSDCYNEYSRSYDWIAFFDCDEFLMLGSYNNIEEYLSEPKFSNYKMIHVNWNCCTDAGLVYNDKRPCMERFYHSPNARVIPNVHIKSIIKGGINRISWIGNPHTLIGYNLPCCDSNGNRTDETSPFCKENQGKSDVVLLHFVTKTAEEYHDKILRGYPDQVMTVQRRKDMIANFFDFNEYTDEKNELLKNNLNVY